MPGRRTVAGAVVAAALVVAPAAPAGAHGAPSEPLSRTLACAPGGPHERSQVCQAALAASDRSAFEDWDYLHLAGVSGQDREAVPDGELCSGGLDEFAGLDIARDDWPASELDPGDGVVFTYRTTIPHQGVFRLYVTVDGYDPTEPLAWSDLEPEPFLTASDPEIVDGAYQLPGRLPADKSGRHLIYTIWQNTDTPDTYYACSDVVFGTATTATPAPASSQQPVTTPAPVTPAPASALASAPAPAGSPGRWLPGGAAAVLALAALATGWLIRRSSHRRAVHRP